MLEKQSVNIALQNLYPRTGRVQYSGTPLNERVISAEVGIIQQVLKESLEIPVYNWVLMESNTQTPELVIPRYTETINLEFRHQHTAETELPLSQLQTHESNQLPSDHLTRTERGIYDLWLEYSNSELRTELSSTALDLKYLATKSSGRIIPLQLCFTTREELASPTLRVPNIEPVVETALQSASLPYSNSAKRTSKYASALLLYTGIPTTGFSTPDVKLFSSAFPHGIQILAYTITDAEDATFKEISVEVAVSAFTDFSKRVFDIQSITENFSARDELHLVGNNGVDEFFLLEELNSVLSNSETTLRLSGRSLTALSDAPYCDLYAEDETLSGLILEDTRLSELVTEIRKSIPSRIHFNHDPSYPATLATHVIPANSFTVSGLSPIQALNELYLSFGVGIRTSGTALVAYLKKPHGFWRTTAMRTAAVAELNIVESLASIARELNQATGFTEVVVSAGEDAVDDFEPEVLIDVEDSETDNSQIINVFTNLESEDMLDFEFTSCDDVYVSELSADFKLLRVVQQVSVTDGAFNISYPFYYGFDNIEADSELAFKKCIDEDWSTTLQYSEDKRSFIIEDTTFTGIGFVSYTTARRKFKAFRDASIADKEAHLRFIITTADDSDENNVVIDYS